MNQVIKSIIEEINVRLSIVAVIPESFDTLQAPVGIDRDLLDEIIHDCKTDNTKEMKEADIIDYLENMRITLEDYIKAFKTEAERLVFMKYQTPETVKYIVAVIGSEGVLNTSDGLNIYRTSDLHLNKGEYLVKNNDYLFVITEEDKKNYDLFKETVKTLPY
jgi:hypothetical protein